MAEEMGNDWDRVMKGELQKGKEGVKMDEGKQ
jgi:hypothetical protein